MATFVNRAKMTTATTGSGTITLGSASSGFQSFAAAGVANGNTVTYVIEDGTAWEIGDGVYTSAGTALTRALVSSSTGSLLVLTGNAVVYVAVNAETMTDIYTQLGLKAPLASPTFTGQASFPDGTAAAPSIAHTGDLNAGLFFPAVDTVAITTAGVEAMRVNSSGNVGIGTSSPTSKLDVSSTNNIISSTGTGGYGAFYAKGSGTNPAYFFMGNATDGELARLTAITGNVLTFSNGNAATERMRIDSAGNVGIGDTTPSTKLDVAGVASAVFYENPQTITANYTITTNSNAMAAGPITIASGVSVTIPSGSVWTVL